MGLRARISEGQLNDELEELGIPATPDTRRLLRLLASEPHALYLMVRRLSELRVPVADELPAIDDLVADAMVRRYSRVVGVELLRKRQPISSQCKRLLGVLLESVGEPVALPELLLANGLRSATPRRLRELETEHGCFRIRSFSERKVSMYVLDSPEPDIEACAAYWLRRNLRDCDLPTDERLLVYLRAHGGHWLPLSDLEYVVPSPEPSKKGLTRRPVRDIEAMIYALRSRGYPVEADDTRQRFRWVNG